MMNLLMMYRVFSFLSALDSSIVVIIELLQDVGVNEDLIGRFFYPYESIYRI